MVSSIEVTSYQHARGKRTYQSNKDRTYSPSPVQFIPQHKIMKPIPILRFDPADNGILSSPFGGNLSSSGNGHQEAISGTFLIHRAGDFAGCFPFLAADVLLDGQYEARSARDAVLIAVAFWRLWKYGDVGI